MKGLIKTGMSRRSLVVTDEKDVIEVIKILNKQVNIEYNQRLVVGKCSDVESYPDWFILATLPAYKWEFVISELKEKDFKTTITTGWNSKKKIEC